MFLMRPITVRSRGLVIIPGTRTGTYRPPKISKRQLLRNPMLSSGRHRLVDGGGRNRSDRSFARRTSCWTSSANLQGITPCRVILTMKFTQEYT